MADKNKVEVKIAGIEYTLVGPETDEYMQKVALYVDKKLNEIMKSNSRLSSSMAATLAAVNIADDYFKVVQNWEDAKNEIEHLKKELEKYVNECKRLEKENSEMNAKNTELQIALAKKDMEIGEVKNSADKPVKPRVYAK